MKCSSSLWRGPFAVGAAFLTAVLLGHSAPAAADTIEAACMQDIAGFGLNCTANDVQISRANVLEIIDECEYPGDTTTFVADFEVVVTAKERFDIGLYFATDGDPNGDGLPRWHTAHDGTRTRWQRLEEEIVSAVGVREARMQLLDLLWRKRTAPLRGQ